jgi:hypothetical protein
MMEGKAHFKVVGAGLFLLAREYFPFWGGWPKDESAVLGAADINPEEARAMKDELRGRLGDYLNDADFNPSNYGYRLAHLIEVLISYQKSWPNSLRFDPKKGTVIYSRQYLGFILFLAQEGQIASGFSLEELSTASGAPLKLLEREVARRAKEQAKRK